MFSFLMSKIDFFIRIILLWIAAWLYHVYLFGEQRCILQLYCQSSELRIELEVAISQFFKQKNHGVPKS